MNYNELNNTELLTMVRAKQLTMPSLPESRGDLIELARAMEGEAPIERNLALTRIDQLRGAIMLWAWRLWPEVYYQISCPLCTEGCWGCSDFRVVSCLVWNDHIFNTAEKEVSMANWGDVLKTVAGKKPAEAAEELKKLAEEKLTGDAKSLGLALMRLAVEVGDIIEKGKPRTILEYVTMAVGENETPAAFKLVSGKSPQEVLLELSSLLKNYAGSGAEPAAPAADLPKPSTSAYFPGVLPADQSAGQDAAKFIKPAEGAVTVASTTSATKDAAVSAPAPAPKPVSPPEPAPKAAEPVPPPNPVQTPQDNAQQPAEADDGTAILLSRLALGFDQMAKGASVIAAALAEASGLHPGSWNNLLNVFSSTAAPAPANPSDSKPMENAPTAATPPPAAATTPSTAATPPKKPAKAMAFPDDDEPGVGPEDDSDPFEEG